MLNLTDPFLREIILLSDLLEGPLPHFAAQVHGNIALRVVPSPFLTVPLAVARDDVILGTDDDAVTLPRLASNALNVDFPYFLS